MVINIENNQRIEIPTWIKTATTDILFKEDEDDRSIPISVLECLLRVSCFNLIFLMKFNE